MFDVGFIEFLLLGIAALIFIKPADWPQVIRKLTGLLHQLRHFGQEVTSEIHEIGQVAQEITGLDGKKHIAYDVSALDDLGDITPEKPILKNTADEAKTQDNAS
jgi:Sec-independent protein translocase protein TatA